MRVVSLDSVLTAVVALVLPWSLMAMVDVDTPPENCTVQLVLPGLLLLGAGDNKISNIHSLLSTCLDSCTLHLITDIFASDEIR